MEELDVVPTVEELSRAIDRLPIGKAPGMDGIPPEIIKCGKGALLDQLYELLCQCWEEDVVPHDMRDCNIITLYKENNGTKVIALFTEILPSLASSARSSLGFP